MSHSMKQLQKILRSLEVKDWTDDCFDVDTNDVRDDLVAKVTGKTDDAIGTGVNIGHDAY